MIITKGIDSDCFGEMLGGKKFYELRLGDFLGRPGDLLALEEKGVDGRRTGRRIAYQITYASTFRLGDLPWGREEIDRHGFAIMSIELLASGRAADVPDVGADVRLKAWPRYFKEVAARRKRYEFRLGDRLCQPGETLRLLEYVSPDDPQVVPEAPLGYTGLAARVRVTQSRRWTLPELGRFWTIGEIERHGLTLVSLAPA